MSGQPFQQQSTGFNNNGSDNNQFDSSYETAPPQQNPRPAQSNTNRTTPDSGLGNDDQNRLEKNRHAPPGFSVRIPPYNQGRHVPPQGAMYFSPNQQPPPQNIPYSGNPQDNSTPQYDGTKYNQQPLPQMEQAGQSYEEPNGNGQFIIQGANEPYDRPSMPYQQGGIMNNGYEMPPVEQGASMYRGPCPPQIYNTQANPHNYVVPPQQAPISVQAQPYNQNTPVAYRPGTSQQPVIMVPMQMASQHHPGQQFYPGTGIPNHPQQMIMNPGPQPNLYLNFPVGIVTRSMSGTSDKEKSNNHTGKNKRGSQNSLEKTPEAPNTDQMSISHFDPNQPANQDYNPNMYNQNQQYSHPQRIIPQVPIGYNQYGAPSQDMNHMQMQQMPYGNGMPTMNMPPPPPQQQSYPQGFHSQNVPAAVGNYRGSRQMGPEPLMANTYQNPIANPRNGGNYQVYQNQHPSYPMANSSFNNGMSRGNGRGRGRGGWRGGHDRDGSFNHSRHNSGNYDNRFNSSCRVGNFDSTYTDQSRDEDVSMLTNRIQRLEPAPRVRLPSKQVLKLYEAKSPENNTESVGENIELVESKAESVEAVVVETEIAITSVEIEKKEAETNPVEEKTEPLHCYKCESMKLPEETYKSHCLKKPNGETWCPMLQKEICDICRATGPKAHSSLVCPKKKERTNAEKDDREDEQQHDEPNSSNFEYSNERRNSERGNRRGGFRGNGPRGSAGGGFGKTRGSHIRGASRGFNKYDSKKS